MMNKSGFLVALAASGIVVVGIVVLLATRSSSDNHAMDDSAARAKPQRALLASERPPEVLGVIVPEQSVQIASNVAGRVLVLEVKLGDEVKQGQLLAKLDEGDLPERIAYAKVAIAKAKTGRHIAKLEYSDAVKKKVRTSKLEAAGGIAGEALETAKARASIARLDQNAAGSSIGLASAELAQLEKALTETEIRAPFDGVVALVYETVGNVVSVGSPLLKINSSGLMVRFAGPPKFMNGLEAGTRVSLVEDTELDSADSKRTEASSFSKATVRRIAPDIDPSSELIIAEADIDENLLATSQLRAGTVVNVWPTSSDLSIPQ
tara:strand:- start:31562 stop:32524 length:963 start_codon:yes stop_codon:yes gene_type:complete